MGQKPHHARRSGKIRRPGLAHHAQQLRDVGTRQQDQGSAEIHGKVQQAGQSIGRRKRLLRQEAFVAGTRFGQPVAQLQGIGCKIAMRQRHRQRRAAGAIGVGDDGDIVDTHIAARREGVAARQQMLEMDQARRGLAFAVIPTLPPKPRQTMSLLHVAQQGEPQLLGPAQVIHLRGKHDVAQGCHLAAAKPRAAQCVVAGGGGKQQHAIGISHARHQRIDRRFAI